ncbi:CHAT domain-containing protein [Leptolyngbya cf. ectocarpi LEGE 11479]|uniref:CHAT domain-containing protein n=1 Tax=Leptolyngbya cf. ectocarpi LEGE 11479 TaxID=1828722 RepID=A0A929FC45_LEPEC|nr:CHAT domain-containing protein [Leptolyngbya ectocarpi]MBE9069697.1 CHAT domain-containing protein [Leptolyngbya cf. ectocarpi LEGE 11479]
MATDSSAIAISGASHEGGRQVQQSTSLDQLLHRGQTHYTAGQFVEAINVWSMAQEHLSQNAFLNRVVVLSNLALAYRQLGNWEKAQTAIDQGFQIISPADSLDSEGLRIYGQLLNTQGSLLFAQGDANNALNTWEQAAQAYTQANYSEGLIKSLINQTQALRSLGFFRDSQNRLRQAQEILAKLDSLPLKSALMRSLGETQRLVGDLDAAQKSLAESLKIAKALPAPGELAITQLSLGNTLQTLAHQHELFVGRTDNSEMQALVDDFYQRAENIYWEISDTAPLSIQIQAQISHLEMAIRHRDWSTARSLKASLLPQLGRLSPGRTKTFIHMRLAQLLLNQCMASCPKDLQHTSQQIYDLLATAQQQAHQLQDPIAESYALGYLGRLYETQKHYSDAIRFTEAALERANHQPTLVYQWEWQLGRIDNQLQRSPESILLHYERAFQHVQEVRKDLRYVGPDVQFYFRDRIEPLYREYIGLLLPKETADIQGDPAQLIRAQTVIDDLRVAELESFLACGLLEPNDNIQRATIQEIANTHKAAIIYPIILPDGPNAERLEVLVQRPTDTSAALERYPSANASISLSPGRQETNEPLTINIEDTLKQFYQAVDSSRASLVVTSTHTQDPEQFQSLATQIYDWLIRPAEQAGWFDDSIDTLIFVLDGAFRRIPMAALYDQETQQFLIEKYAIATTFGNLEIPKAPPEEDFRVLAAGLSYPSVLPSTSVNSNELTENNQPSERPFSSLVYVEQELIAIKEIIKDTDIFLNLEFKKEDFQTQIASSLYNVVHLATHGIFGFTRDETFLLVSADEASVQSDQGVAASIIEPIKVEKIDLNDFDSFLRPRKPTPLELLVLSACQTATGDNREVLGIAGLAIQSGARSTLASLWNIEDASTSLLMEEFYRALLNPDVSKAKALQKAQVSLIQKGRQPNVWAPYILVGDWR